MSVTLSVGPKNITSSLAALSASFEDDAPLPFFFVPDDDDDDDGCGGDDVGGCDLPFFEEPVEAV